MTNYQGTDGFGYQYNQSITTVKQANIADYFNQQAALQQLQTLSGKQASMADGSKPVVICNGVVREVKDLDEAQLVAEREAHQHSANAYILKPVRMVAPKRDVVTTDLP